MMIPKKHIFSLVVFSMALTGCDSAPYTNQIEKAIQSSFDEPEELSKKFNRYPSDQLFFQSVEKTGKCEPSQDKANVLLCPVKMRVKQVKVGEPIPRYYDVTDKISIYQKDGVWKADDNLKSQILLSIIFSDANEALLGRLNPENLK
ncbi:hypothetical protein [Photorhabdus heterorhabditis]|uniref:hypothetical protein n=1 Tax=Photorhabdus heterorhabditis TaxID=880156 RepID=UPI001BD29422|nr:hypothetical protein [Photorhabdus heterorhabditis]MBS9444343.1 hypothetical protein [Photorhabdus heterorhabditis]